MLQQDAHCAQVALIHIEIDHCRLTKQASFLSRVNEALTGATKASKPHRAPKHLCFVAIPTG